ncbi:MAG TPA: PDZ domain-containing protein [Polyangiales bacterium]|jgi:hypothetical protein|nr:PDZ domain-containing protein [Polyangiales bacterium]
MLWMLVLAVASGCAYPRRETLAYPAPANPEAGRSGGEPSGMYSIRLIGAELPPFKGAGLPWDEDGSPPDPYLKLILGDRVVWESPAQENTLHPQWNVTLPRNVYVSSNTRFRLEMWDRDSGSSDPAGSIQRMGLPETALPDAAARLPLDNLGAVTVMLSAPKASRGVGVRYEAHGDGLLVLDVEPFSPAARAGVKKDDLIVAIGESRVEAIGGNKAGSELSLAGDRGYSLTLQAGKSERVVQLDRDFLWLTM